MDVSKCERTEEHRGNSDRPHDRSRRNDRKNRYRSRSSSSSVEKSGDRYNKRERRQHYSSRHSRSPLHGTLSPVAEAKNGSADASKYKQSFESSSSCHRQRDSRGSHAQLSPSLTNTRDDRKRYQRDRSPSFTDGGRQHAPSKQTISSSHNLNVGMPNWEELHEDKPNLIELNAEQPNLEEVEKPNFQPSGKLAEDTNMFKGVVIKYNEPPEARIPKVRWRLYPFRGDDQLDVLYIHRQSAYMISREKKLGDILVEHPSCSKQHAVLQYRSIPYVKSDGSKSRRVLPYIIDLGSANGTFLNGDKIEPQRYYELKENDMLKFGFSSRDFLVMKEKSEKQLTAGGDTSDASNTSSDEQSD
ncbi:hypothetical protein QR680_011374 [Steinernema hermaphroditum]|uniref:FHA domain-containing protein n=1 Tax=Steinernema hermaphroditum TaxID=289476 RepID=A0AA39MD44_9BILA|nr:hypothetical protein QR680_011374 [Steinernema hermaphroditum]